jgi:V8-like Glu-specific endopeptidase
MSWNKRLTQLNDALAVLIPFAGNTLAFLTKAKINFGLINFDGGSSMMWHNILTYADNNNKVDQLVDEIMKVYPNNPYLKAYKESASVLQEYDLGEDIKTVTWKGLMSEDRLDTMAAERTASLPIRFLALGLEKAKAVARVVVPKPDKNELGSGFLIGNNLFVTAHHLIGDIETAKLTKIQFSYEAPVNGVDVQPEEFKLDTSVFFTSSKEGWTVAKIIGDPVSKFGSLSLSDRAVKAGDIVNIIQHPGGGFKQIALHNNIVVYADDRIVQYLTINEPGSTGSCILDSNWEVVAMHNSAGVVQDPGFNLKFLRNQGVNIRQVSEGLKLNNLV